MRRVRKDGAPGSCCETTYRPYPRGITATEPQKPHYGPEMLVKGREEGFRVRGRGGGNAVLTYAHGFRDIVGVGVAVLRVREASRLARESGEALAGGRYGGPSE